jgi:hypothetical protein
MFSRFEDSKPENIERSLRMPAIESSIDPDQENALQDVFRGATFAM